MDTRKKVSYDREQVDSASRGHERTSNPSRYTTRNNLYWFSMNALYSSVYKWTGFLPVHGNLWLEYRPQTRSQLWFSPYGVRWTDIQYMKEAVILAGQRPGSHDQS